MSESQAPRMRKGAPAAQRRRMSGGAAVTGRGSRWPICGGGGRDEETGPREDDSATKAGVSRPSRARRSTPRAEPVVDEFPRGGAPSAKSSRALRRSRSGRTSRRRSSAPRRGRPPRTRRRSEKTENRARNRIDAVPNRRKGVYRATTALSMVPFACAAGARAMRGLRAAKSSASRRGGRAAEGARLESVYAGNRIAGSNPAPSASAIRKRRVRVCKPLKVLQSARVGVEQDPNRLIEPGAERTQLGARRRDPFTRARTAVEFPG